MWVLRHFLSHQGLDPLIPVRTEQIIQKMARVFFYPTTSRNDPEILKQTTKSSDYSNVIRLRDLPLI